MTANNDRKRLRVGGARAATLAAAAGCCALALRGPTTVVDAFAGPSTHSSRTRRRTTTTLHASSSKSGGGPSSEENWYHHKHQSGWSAHWNEKENGYHHPKSGLSAATLTEVPAGAYDFPDFETAKDIFSLNDRSLSSLPRPPGLASAQQTVSEMGDWKNLMSAALLITGNTVGASILCLPEYCAGPGMQISSSLLMGIFGINLISGLLIAEVAIKQHEESDGGEVPSSFKDFADATLDNPLVGNGIASVSIFTNMCVLSYSLMQAGDVARGFGMDGTMAAMGVAGMLTALVGSQTNAALSRVASVACTVLFASFAGILLPGLANVQDPMGTLLASGTADAAGSGVVDSCVSAVPIFLSAMVYQNIVPSITKLLNYDRSKSAAAIFLGSLLPTVMYLSFSFATLGGGIDGSVAGGGMCLTAFSAAALAGSSIACVMSIAEEFDSVLSNFFSGSSSASASAEVEDSPAPTEQTFSLPSVLLAVAPPLLAGLLFSGGESFSAALKYSGGYGVPALYGVLPVVLAFAQNSNNKSEERRGEEPADLGHRGSLVPGGFASLSLLGAASAGFVGQEVLADVSGAFASAAGAVA